MLLEHASGRKGFPACADPDDDLYPEEYAGVSGDGPVPKPLA